MTEETDVEISLQALPVEADLRELVDESEDEAEVLAAQVTSGDGIDCGLGGVRCLEEVRERFERPILDGVAPTHRKLGVPAPHEAEGSRVPVLGEAVVDDRNPRAAHGLVAGADEAPDLRRSGQGGSDRGEAGHERQQGPVAAPSSVSDHHQLSTFLWRQLRANRVRRSAKGPRANIGEPDSACGAETDEHRVDDRL